MSNKLIIRNSVVLYIRLIATMFIGILSSRFVLNSLGVSDFGLYSVVAGIMSMMAFVNTVMISTTYRYIAYELGKAEKDVNKIFNISLVIHLVLSVVIIAAAFSFGLFYIRNYLVVPVGKLPDAVFTFCFTIINTICIVIGTPFQGLLVAREKFTVTVPIEIFTKVFNLGLVILLGFLPGNHLRIYVVFVTLVYMLNPIMYFLYCIRNYFDNVRWKFQKDWVKYKEMLMYSGWTMLSTAASIGENQGSAMIINRFFGTILNASFGIANQVNSMVQMFSRSLGQAIVPQITKSYSSGDHKRSSQLVILSSKFSFFLMLIPMLPILLETDFILGIWLKQVPQYTKIFVQAMLLKSLILAMESGIPSLIGASGKIKYFHIASSVILLLSIPIAFYVYALGYPPYSISFIYIFSSLTTIVVDIWMLRIVLNYNVREYIQKAVLKMLIVVLCVLPLFVFHEYMHFGVFRFFISLIISEIVLFAAIFYFGMESNERNSIVKYGQLALSKFKRD